MATKKTPETLYRITFQNEGEVFVIHARQLYQSDMWGFIEFEEVVFGSQNSLVVDPGEEKLRNEFKGVKRTFIPMHSIVRIDEVEEAGSSKVRAAPTGDKVKPFPVPPGMG